MPKLYGSRCRDGWKSETTLFTLKYQRIIKTLSKKYQQTINILT